MKNELKFLILLLLAFIACTNSTREVRTTYKSGKPHFVYVYPDKQKDSFTYTREIYYESGVLESIGDFVNRQKEGKWVKFHENGNKAEEAEYKNGNYVGERVFYFSLINKIR